MKSGRRQRAGSRPGQTAPTGGTHRARPGEGARDRGGSSGLPAETTRGEGPSSAAASSQASRYRKYRLPLIKYRLEKFPGFYYIYSFSFFFPFFFLQCLSSSFFLSRFFELSFFFDDNSSGAGLMGSNLVTFMNLWICRKVERATGKGGLTLFLSHTTVIYDIHHDLSFLSLFFLTSFHL